MTRLPALILAAVLLIGQIPPAAATTGGALSLEVLGVDPADGGKIFLLERSDAGELPVLRFARPDQPLRGLRVAKSWLDPEEEDYGRFEVRLKKLRARLKPLKKLPAAALKLEARVVGEELCLYGAADLDGDRCRVTDVRLRWGKLRGQVRAHGWDAGTLRGVWATPSGDLAVAIWRHRGRTYEGGYSEDLAFLLHDTPLPPPGPWRSGCDKRCSIMAAGRVAWQFGRGALRCAESPIWVACVWTSPGERRHQGVYVDRRSGRALPFPTVVVAMEALGLGSKVAGAPRWEKGAVRLTLVDKDGKRTSTLRLPPPLD